MKKLSIILLMFWVTAANAQSNRDTLTNEKIVSLLKAGLAPSIVITKIKTGITNFNLSTDELIKLNNAGVPSDIINAMIKSKNHVEDDFFSNDSVSIYKKWKDVALIKNGLIEELKTENEKQYFKDGTYVYNILILKNNSTIEVRGKFELLKESNSITFFPEKGESYTLEIIKLTKNELYTKGTIGENQYESHYVLIEE